MTGLFTENHENSPVKKTICDHKYKPFRPVYHGRYNFISSNLHYELIQSFVCLKCGNRVDRTLLIGDQLCGSPYSAEQFAAKNFPNAVNKLDVESEIAKIQLKVDDDYISAYESLKNPKSEFDTFLYKEVPKEGGQKMEV